jgi:hypothetical protein
MGKLLGTILGLVGFGWFIWATTLSGMLMFAYLGAKGWDAHLAYGVSLVGLTPLIGGIIASFMAEPTTGWGFFHALFNLVGWVVLFGIAGSLGAGRRRKAEPISTGEGNVFTG